MAVETEEDSDRQPQADLQVPAASAQAEVDAEGAVALVGRVGGDKAHRMKLAFCAAFN